MSLDSQPTSPNQYHQRGTQQGHLEGRSVDAPDNTELADVADQLEVPENASGIRPGIEVPYKPIDIEPKKSRKGLYAGIAIAVVAAGGFGASKVFGSADSPEDPRPSTKPTASGPVTPGPSETSTPEVTPTPTESVFDTPNGANIDPSLIKSLDSMGSDEFGAYPISARTDYGLAKYWILSENGSLYDHLDQELPGGNFLYDYNPFQKPLNQFADGQDIMWQNIYAEQVANAWKKDITTAGGGELDQNTASKLIAVEAYDPSSEFYKDRLDSIANATTSSRVDKNTVAGALVINTEDLGEQVQADGSPRHTVELTMVIAGNTYKEKFAFVDKSKVLGEGNGLWLQIDSKRIKQ